MQALQFNIGNINQGAREVFPGTNCWGTTYRVQTNLGSAVRAWVPEENVPLDQCYFCHGHALETYYEHGYTVFSGLDLLTVLADEWVTRPNLNSVAVNDIIVWFSAPPVAQPIHSALVRAVGMDANGVTPSTITVSSKNGSNPLVRNLSVLELFNQRHGYGNRIRAYRRVIPYVRNHGFQV
jgi:hypothetical protein